MTQKKLKEHNVSDAMAKTNLLLEYVLNLNKTELFFKDMENISQEKLKKINEYILEIIEGKPIQYITNSQEFMGLDFYVNEDVLIPQPDTEILVEEAIKKIFEIHTKVKQSNIKVLDLCTGSGAIAIAIEKHTRKFLNQNNPNINLDIMATDISQNAIEIAIKNAQKHNSKVRFEISNMFENIKEKDFDLIVSNPPYIESRTIESLSKEVQNEPRIALDGGNDGLNFYRIIAKQAAAYLKNNGYILVEIGYNQKQQVMQLFKNQKEYVDIACSKDFSNNDRVIEARIEK